VVRSRPVLETYTQNHLNIDSPAPCVCVRAVEERCFNGPDAVADMLVFWSMPVLMHRFTAVMEATLNSRTGQRFFNVMSGKGFTSEGRTTNPDTGATIDNTEPESASSSSPIYEFDFADKFAEFLPTTAADKCGACFVCKWPEMRLAWLVVAGISSITSPTNVFQFVGNVTNTCLGNGSWYQDACGPWPTTGDDTMLPWSTWSKLPWAYDAGFHERDDIIVNHFSARFLERAHEMGAAVDQEFALLVEASHIWQQARDAGSYQYLLNAAPGGVGFADEAEPKAAAFTYHTCRVARHEAKKRSQLFDVHNDYHLLAGNSIEKIASEYLFKT